MEGNKIMKINYIDYKSCEEVKDEYDTIQCVKCKSRIYSWAMPEELSDIMNHWEDAWQYIGVDRDNNIQPNANANRDYSSVFRKYFVYANEYGLQLKEEYCPTCRRKKEMERDPEYKEYLRLKAKFDNF